jgi:hypothetical protein
MSEELDTIVDNIRQPSVWIRIVFMLGFAVVLNVIILPIIIVLLIVQALFSVITGESNENLRFFAAALEQYVSQIVKFLTYNSETKPFPFSEFPQLEDDLTASPAEPGGDSASAKTQAKASQKQATKKESTEKKTSSKKSASEKTAAKKPPAKKPPAKKAGAKKSAAGNDNSDSSVKS